MIKIISIVKWHPKSSKLFFAGLIFYLWCCHFTLMIFLQIFSFISNLFYSLISISALIASFPKPIPNYLFFVHFWCKYFFKRNISVVTGNLAWVDINKRFDEELLETNLKQFLFSVWILFILLIINWDKHELYGGYEK